jgi:hypothetical protein
MGFWDFMSGSSPAGVISDTGQKVVAGVFQGVKDLIEEFHLSPEQAQTMKLKLAEIELQAYQAQITDVQSARQMQMANKSPWPGILTFVLLVGFFGVLIMIIMQGMPSMDQAGGQAILLMIGALITGFGTALHFWLGGTRSGQDKDEMLANSVPASTLAPKP